MNKKLFTMGIIGAVFVVVGLLYSCTFKKDTDSKAILSSLSELEADNKTEIDDSEILDLDESLKEDNLRIVNEEFGDEHSSEKDRLEVGIYIHICGAIANPGVYNVDREARIIDLIELAGGLLSEAAGDYINQAQSVADGQRIYIPTKEEIIDLNLMEIMQDDNRISEKEQEKTSDLININEADAKELMKLPGIGQVKADSILEYRDTKGEFQTIEEVMNITGIKEGLFNQISSYLVIN